MGLKLKASKDTISFNGKQPMLVSGVYYIPVIDEEGYLTWIASGADMPEVEKAYVRGEPGKDGYTPIKGVDYFDGTPGKSGVYIGETPGEDDLVWINPNEEYVSDYYTKEEIDNLLANLPAGEVLPNAEEVEF